MSGACGRRQSVRAILTRNPVTVGPHTSLAAAWELMRVHHFRHLPVVDERGELCGMLSDRDILGVLGLDRAGTHTVAEVMQTEVDVVGPDCCMEAAARFMLSSKRSSLPVMARDGSVLGIVTESDFLLYAVQGAPPCACEPWKVLT